MTEAITRQSPRTVRAALSRQVWRHVVFLHWPYDPDVVRPLLPMGTSCDLHEGRAWVGLIGRWMSDVHVAGLPPIPGLTEFPEVHLRLCAVDGAGRRGVVLLAAEAASRGFVYGSRGAVRLPYHHAEMGFLRAGTDVLYQAHRLWPDPRGAAIGFTVHVGAPTSGGELEHFLTARWGMNVRAPGMTLHLPITHEPWPLRAADLVDFSDKGLFAAAGLPSPEGPPTSVLYAPSAHARVGLPAVIRAAGARQ